ncbi:hypothetical protein Xfasm12_0607 [Xylella fastidiosa M12]|nr:hypothetical protein Xfasm12_0607 [Xylella fastidiosa M12]
MKLFILFASVDLKKENQKLYKYSNWVGLIIFRFFIFW